MMVNTAIIGAGPAGLAVSALLSENEIEHILIEKSALAGGLYATLHPQLSMLSPPLYNSLPGIRFPGGQNESSVERYHAYLCDYIERTRPPLKLNTHIHSVKTHGRGYCLESNDGWDVEATHVVIATGLSSFPKSLDFDMPASVEYQLAKDWKGIAYYLGKRVLIVGSGISAVELAELLAGHAEVTLVVNKRITVMPLKWFGINFHHFIRPLELLPKALMPHICQGRFHERAIVRHGGDFLRNGQVRVIEAKAGRSDLIYAAEFLVHYDIVINATGYRYDTRILPADLARDSNGNVLTQSCESVSHPRLFMMGYPCGGGIDSPFLRGIRRDAYRVAARIEQESI